MHRKLAMVVLAMWILILSGCGSADGEISSMQPEETEDAAVAEDGENENTPEIVTEGSDDARIKVGMVTDAGGLDDHSFNQGAWDGLQSLNEQLDARISYVETTDADEFYDGLCVLAESGCDLCWGVGYSFADAILEAAEAYPDTHFAIVDYEYDEIPSNVTCATFRAEESSFEVGYIAAAVSQTGKVGFVGGMEDGPLEAFQYGYMAGVAQANQDFGKDTEVVTEYIGTFVDMEKGKDAAEKMYADGCDIIFHAAGGAGAGVIEAAKDEDKYVIGVDSDQSYLAPENVLTSAVKKVGVVVSNIPVQYDMGEQIGGIAIEYGVSERAVGIPTDHPNFSDELYDAVMQIEQKIILNEISVPKNAEEYEALAQSKEELLEYSRGKGEVGE